jgi:hypothetical protein
MMQQHRPTINAAISSVSNIPTDLSFLTPIVVDDLIRIGADHDGGYVIPKFLVSATDTLISMGVNEDWSFDEEMLSLNPSIKLHAYDHTISEGKFKQAIALSLANLLRGRSSISRCVGQS